MNRAETGSRLETSDAGKPWQRQPVEDRNTLLFKEVPYILALCGRTLSCWKVRWWCSTKGTTVGLRSSVLLPIQDAINEFEHFSEPFYWPDHNACLCTAHTYWPPLCHVPWLLWVELFNLRLESTGVAKWHWTTGFEQRKSFHEQIHQESEQMSWHSICFHHFMFVHLYYCWVFILILKLQMWIIHMLWFFTVKEINHFLMMQTSLFHLF